jgi:hypothetical protein
LVAVVFAYSRWPALFFAGVVGLVAAALALGAAGEVGIVAIAAAVCAALTLGAIERSRRNWTAPPRRGIALISLSLLAGMAATGAVLLQAHNDPRDPVLVAQGRQFPGIKPAWTDPLAADSASGGTAARQVTSPQTPRQTSKPAAKPATESHGGPVRQAASRSIWSYVVAAIVLVVLVLTALVATRLLSTRLAWRRTRRRLALGAPADQVIGAWAWTRMRLEACRLPLAVALSPDLVVAGRAMDTVPADVYMPLQALAARATTAAFAREPSLRTSEVAVAWRVADKAAKLAREHLTRSARTRLAFRGPAWAALSRDEGAPRAAGQQVAGRRRTATQAVIIMAASGLVLCFATLAWFGVFSSGGGAVPTVSTPTKQVTATVATPAPSVRAPTTPHRALVSPAQAPSRTLAPGDSGSQVEILQRALAALGFLAAKPDGDYGLATQSAVERFQASERLPQVGVVGPRTLAALRHALSRRPG